MRESPAFKSCMGRDMERNVGGIRNLEIRGSTSKRLFRESTVRLFNRIPFLCFEKYVIAFVRECTWQFQLALFCRNNIL